jgi:putative FmdB family regulatory protein
MPAFDYACPCGEKFSRTLPISKRDEAQFCPSCSSESPKIATEVAFVLRGDGWFGKNLTIKRQMEEKNRVLETRQKERYGGQVSLAPNVDGERVDSWREAKSLAASKGKDTSSYDRFVAKESAK